MGQYFYEGLIGRLEAEADKNPAVYRSKVLMISCAPYLGLFAVLAILATVLYFCFHWFQDVSGFAKVKIVLFACATVPIFFVVLRMFFMRLPPPEGVPLTRAQAPKLFAVLDKMRKKLKGPVIHHVLINEEYNAAIQQRPRWGLFGGHTSYLILGLPYLLGVPPQEMLATSA